jgi:uncharacterized protein
MTSTERPPPEQSQEAVLEFLSRHDPECKRVDTHASIVFLGPDRVLKVKRAVRLPFLDYSTLERRRRACEEELIVNQRFAPDLYRRVVSITQGSGGLEVGGDGPAAEWAVEMARFDDSKTFDHLANAGAITPELADAFAGVLYAAHQRAPASDTSNWVASIAGIIDRNTETFSNEATLPRGSVARLHALSHQQFNANRKTLQDRASNGFVRRCHGDAHLGNIALIDGKPILFDAIEFDPVIATNDVLYDLAFPVMDFCHFGLTACADRLLNGYLQATWSENGNALGLLPLFLSMRAAIRSNVFFTKRRLSPNQDHDAKDAEAYFELALQHIEPGRPSLIAIGGKSGTGKSVLARNVAALLRPLPGAILLRSDVIRKGLFGYESHVTLPQAAYTADVTARVYTILLERSWQILGQGFSVVIDAAFLKQSEREELSKAAERIDATFRPIFLDADLKIRLDRIRLRANDASDATPKVAAAQEDFDLGRIDWPIVDASGSIGQTLERSRTLLVSES